MALHNNIRINYWLQAAVQAINQWRVSSGSGKPPLLSQGADKNAHEVLPGNHHKQQNPASGNT